MNNDQTAIHHSDVTRHAEDNTVLGSNATVAETGTANTVENNSGNASAAETVPIEKGTTILNLYRVESDPFIGGFGRVFRVHHSGWKVDLAMKQPKREVFQSKQQKDDFTNECKHWIELGLHPHIVSCYYVREIDGIPSIFAEWMNGGSLKGFIENGALYEGSEKEVQERILDISIQFARGLHYAQEQGLIHRDVKPDNLLLTSDGRAKLLTAKVADFGIAGAKEKVTDINANTNSPEGGTIVKNGNAYTPRYCSLEQMNGEELTRRTDIWSWAVSVLEMYVGDHPWFDGTVAGSACEDYFDMARVSLPEAMKDLLSWCFKENEAERPRDFGVVEAELLKIYQNETGNVYPRPEPKAASHTADSLNNRALSYFDLGEKEEAEKCWEEAVRTDPNNAIIRYNQSIYNWKNKDIDDMEAIHQLTSVPNKDEKYFYCLTKLHIARADAESAIKCINEAIAIYGETEDLKHALTEAQNMEAKGLDGRCIHALEKVTSTGWVESVCFSPDSRLFLSGSDDRNIKLWNITTGECIRTLEGHTDQVNSVCFSPDGRLILSGSNDQKVKLWDVATGKCIRTLEGHKNQVKSVCFSPDGRLILSGSRGSSFSGRYEGGMMMLWDIEIGEYIHTFVWSNSMALSVCFSPDGRLALSGDDNKNVIVWDIATGKRIHILEGHESGVYSVCFSPDGKLALSGSWDKTIKLWDIATGRCVRTIKGHRGGVLSVCFSPDGKLILSGGDDETNMLQYDRMKLWDAATGKCIRSFQDNHTVSSACFSSDGRLALSGSWDKTIKVWNIPVEQTYEMLLSHIQSTELIVNKSDSFHSTLEEIEQLINKKEISFALAKLKELQSLKSFISEKAYFEINKKLASYCISLQLNHCSLRIIPNVSSNTNPLYDHYWDMKNNRVLTEEIKEETVKIWDMEANKCIHTLNTGRVTFVCISLDGRQILTGDINNMVKLWDVATGKCIRILQGHTSYIKYICFSPDGKLVFSGSNDNTMKVWDITTGGCIHTLKNDHSDTAIFNDMCFSLDGRQVLSIMNNKKVKIWDVATGKCLCTLGEHKKDKIFSACFSPDGQHILYGNQEIKGPIIVGKIPDSLNTVKLWDIAADKCVHELKKHNYPVSSVSFCPSGRLALSGSLGMVKLWNIETEECIQTFEGFTAKIIKLCFSSDGQEAIVATGNGIYIYSLYFDLHFPGWHDWDEGARPYLEIFLTLHPNWTNEDFNNILIPDLQNRGYGWIRPEGVRVELEKMDNQKTSFWKRIIGGK
jgi:WD40 repeat protein